MPTTYTARTLEEWQQNIVEIRQLTALLVGQINQISSIEEMAGQSDFNSFSWPIDPYVTVYADNLALLSGKIADIGTVTNNANACRYAYIIEPGRPESFAKLTIYPNSALAYDENGDLLPNSAVFTSMVVGDVVSLAWHDRYIGDVSYEAEFDSLDGVNAIINFAELVTILPGLSEFSKGANWTYGSGALSTTAPASSDCVLAVADMTTPLVEGAEYILYLDVTCSAGSVSVSIGDAGYQVSLGVGVPTEKASTGVTNDVVVAAAGEGALDITVTGIDGFVGSVNELALIPAGAVLSRTAKITLEEYTI